jgi:hypothetical protein
MQYVSRQPGYKNRMRSQTDMQESPLAERTRAANMLRLVLDKHGLRQRSLAFRASRLRLRARRNEMQERRIFCISMIGDALPLSGSDALRPQGWPYWKWNRKDEAKKRHSSGGAR